MSGTLQKLAAHLAWADAEVLRSLRASRETPGSDERALTLYAHVVAAEAVWLARIAGRTPDVAVWPTMTLDEAAALARRNADELASLMASSSASDLAREITYRNSAGAEFRSQVEDMLLQVATHGCYHRGQIALLIRASGGEPAPSDYIAFVRGAPAARTQPPVPLAQPR
jgi:uncharacterized damage-inducible protein DinB